MCVHGQEYLRVCDCWNPPRLSLCVLCKSAQQLLSWHYAVCLHTHIFLLDFIKTPSAVSLHTQWRRGRNKAGNYFLAISGKSLKTSCSGSITCGQQVYELCGLTRPCVCLSVRGEKSHGGKRARIDLLSVSPNYANMHLCIHTHTQSGCRVPQCCTGAAWALAGPSNDRLMVISLALMFSGRCHLGWASILIGQWLWASRWDLDRWHFIAFFVYSLYSTIHPSPGVWLTGDLTNHNAESTILSDKPTREESYSLRIKISW